ncbi:trifunctional serine/threonine-protein kinase/ATP-binding protein/sensor histidine kinase [Bradyrhizobium iriomotense]|uniref:histidine kinase n=1 Tax=Bradyrhizobium iriomotense TaxID=441950 RepID=A0ABQ6AUN0_9BRAD|nr:ATP-binding sensor histidine kinase [Bradyrhizobium iriomotense]GLR85263.1 serine/threonine protein kinase [Bradyrhizobium iriomotense]
MDAVRSNGRFHVAWEDGERVFCRGWHRTSDGNLVAALAVRPSSEHPRPAIIDRLAHEYAWKDELDPAWAVRPLDLLHEGGRTVLLLEDPGGEPLANLIGVPMEVESFLPLAMGIAVAVGNVHRRGLIHKDLKPTNIFVNGTTGEVKLTGFGIASRLPREHQSPSPPEVIAGTLPYMSPEQTGRMNRSIDTRSDLYSLGVTFYQMLTGSLPFSAIDPMEWVHCHIARHPMPPNERVNAIPAPVAAIVLKLLAKNAESRYQTAAGVEADLLRCLSEWDAHGRIHSFALAIHDTSDRLLIPEKLYGREVEVDSLFAAFDRVVTDGMTEIVLISGCAGIGKSSVVNELHKALVPPRGLFASGKFDQYKRDIPYATLAQAFQSLVRQLLSKNDEEISLWRALLLDALGFNGQLMIKLIPELALIIGEQPAVPELPPQEDYNRFQRVFRRFVGVFARPEHPLALFLDDLQWLDTGTLEMLEHLATHPEIGHLLLVGAYRHNEVGASHPLKRILETIRAAGGRVRETLLAPLKQEAIEQMVAESLHCGQVSAQPLANLIHQKTEGNPFFAIQFFLVLGEEGLLQFDHTSARWAWDVSRIRAKGFSDNVLELMAGKLRRLPDTTRSALGQLACLGNLAEIATIILVHGEPEENIHATLREAVLAGLIFKVEGAYKFIHDRVHEAAYGLIPESERAATHLRIGRVLAARTAPNQLEDAIFDILNHLNRGVALIKAHDEREQVAALNVLAGKRAKSSTAYASARNYLMQATKLSSPNAWTSRYEQTFELYLLLSECEYLAGNFEAADALFDIILGRASSNLDRAKVHSLRIKLYQVAGKYDQGLAVALNALSSFGVTFPDTDQDITAAIEAQFGNLPVNLAGRPIGALLDAAVAIDPVRRTIIELLVDATPCAYIARPPLFPLVALEGVNRSIRDGNTEQSSYVYGVFALWLVSLKGDIGSAYQFSEMSLRLNERFNNLRLRGTLLHLHGDHVNFWRRHFATGLPILEQAFEACLEVGDLVYAGFLAFETVWQLIEKGDALEDVLTSAGRYAAFAKQSHNDAVFETIRIEQQFIASLQGRTKTPLSFEDGTFDEATCFATIARAAFGCGIVFYHIMKQILAVLYGQYEDAMEAAVEAESVLGAAMAMPIEATHHFCHALTLTGLYPTASALQQEHYRSLLDEKLKKLRLWADNCPENYHSRYALVSAEIARIEQRDMDAMRLYEEAIRSAHEGGLIHNEAMASELAGQFYLAVGLETGGYAHLRNARACFLVWGADGKVRQLDELYPHLKENEPAPGVTSTISAPIEHLDLATVIKVSQAISGEIVLQRLVDSLMRMAVEQAGAERGLLIVVRGDKLQVEAEATSGGDTLIFQRGGRSVTTAMLPESMLQYVLRSRESVILGDAITQSPFDADPYVRERQARSILCLPLITQAKLIGVLYLENNITPHVFAPARIALLKLVASQAAIALENSRLYSDLQEREAKIRRLVDANIIGIVIFDLESRIIEANDAFLRIVGYDRAALASGQIRGVDLTAPEWRDRNAQMLEEVKTTGIAQPYEKEYLRRDGSRVPVLVGAASFEESGSQGVAFVLDLTERRRAESEARESERRYRETQTELAHANRVATMGQLTASIAHEVNQPITAMIGNAEASLRWLARRPPDLAEVRQLLERIAKDGRRVGNVVDRTRNLVKRAPLRTERVEINAAIDEVIELTRAEATKSHISVRTQFAEDLPPVGADRTQLQQVILNLIINAVYALNDNEARRELLISTSTDGSGGVLVSVRDSGKGISPEQLERLFDPFYTTKPGGMGMGLSICRSIIESHGGRIWAAANPPQGAAFHFTIPQLDNVVV